MAKTLTATQARLLHLASEAGILADEYPAATRQYHALAKHLGTKRNARHNEQLTAFIKAHRRLWKNERVLLREASTHVEECWRRLVAIVQDVVVLLEPAWKDAANMEYVRRGVGRWHTATDFNWRAAIKELRNIADQAERQAAKVDGTAAVSGKIPSKEMLTPSGMKPAKAAVFLALSQTPALSNRDFEDNLKVKEATVRRWRKEWVEAGYRDMDNRVSTREDNKRRRG